jgi:hypothetical protein
MKNKLVKNFSRIVITAVLAFICSAGHAQKITSAAPVQGGVKLEYRYPDAKTFKYVTDSKIIQDMEVNGQSMLVNVTMYLGCEVTGAGKSGDNLKLSIKIDSMAQNVESPQASAGGPIVDVAGKVFNMVISPSGKTIDLTEASKIVYTVQGSGENTMTLAFLNYFPVLPKGVIKPGYTWVTNDTTDSKTPTNTILMPVQSNFTFEGIESVDGIDCAKMTATLSGTRKMITQSQGMEIHTSGPYTGTQVVFVAIKEGYLVKETVTTRMSGTLEIPDQNMSFPVVMTVTATNELAK